MVPVEDTCILLVVGAERVHIKESVLRAALQKLKDARDKG